MLRVSVTVRLTVPVWLVRNGVRPTVMSYNDNKERMTSGLFEGEYGVEYYEEPLPKKAPVGSFRVIRARGTEN